VDMGTLQAYLYGVAVHKITDDPPWQAGFSSAVVV
jgi:hypothetical protein